MKRIISIQKEARKKLKEGVNKAVAAIKPTLGPKGCSALIYTKSVGIPLVIDDGASIAKLLQDEDPLVNAGMALIQEVASQADMGAADGTTTASLIADSIISGGIDAIEAGHSQRSIKNGIDAATEAAVEYINEHKKEVKSDVDLLHVAKVSSNNDKMASIISEAVSKVGKRGIIHVENGFSTETTTSIISGLHYERGYLSPNFINNPATGSFEVQDCKILIMDHSFTASDDAQHLLQLMAHKGIAVLVIAENIEDNVLGWFRANAVRGAVKICAIRTPGHGALKKMWIEDIAKFTGATILGDTTGIELDNLNPEQDPESMNSYMSIFGTANVVVNANETVLMKEKLSEDALKHIESLEAQKEQAPTPYDKNVLEERIVNMNGSVATIKVGGLTDTEIEAKKAKYEDAKNATKSALEEGYVLGGGSIYLAASLYLQELLDKKYLEGLTEDEKVGFKIVIKALRTITKQLGDNANDVGDVIVRDVMDRIKNEYGDDPLTGYDAENNEICNLYERGIIDSVKVVVNSLRKAVSIAGTVLMTATVVTEQAEESDKINHALAMSQRR